MTTAANPSQLAFFQEVTTQGLGPADAAAWAAGGFRIRHLAESVDVSGLQQAVVEDERSQTTIFGLNNKVKGLRNVQLPASIYLTGSGVTTDPASQIALTDLMRVLAHAFGGIHRSNSTLLTGGAHSTTTINVTANTNIVHGCLIGVEDTSGDSIIYVRRVLDVNTLAIVLDEALPFTPVDGDVVHGMATIYIDETVLVDSAVNVQTMSVLVQKGLAAALENWELNGCKVQLNSVSLPRGGLPVVASTIFAASFDPPGVAPSPTWVAAPSGAAPVAIGPNCECFYQTYGTTTLASVQVSEVTTTLGVPVVIVETNTEVDDGMEGIACYSTQPADTTLAVSIVPMASTHWSQFAADTMKVFRWSKIAGPGQVFALHYSRCEINSQPKRGVANAVSRVDLDLRAHPDLPNSEAALPQLWASKALIGIG